MRSSSLHDERSPGLENGESDKCGGIRIRPRGNEWTTDVRLASACPASMEALACGSMDSLITAAGLGLAAGDPLGALKRIALRNDAPALALRGIAMAQLGDLARATTLLRRAARAFGASEPVARARCIVAEAEIALASRDLGWSTKALDAARTT